MRRILLTFTAAAAHILLGILITIVVLSGLTLDINYLVQLLTTAEFRN